MGFFDGIKDGFGCAGHGCGFVIGAIFFIIAAAVVLKMCAGG